MSMPLWSKRLAWIFKLLFFLASCWLIYGHLKSEISESGSVFFGQHSAVSSLNGSWLILTLFLALLNWFAEAVKWRYIVSPLEQVRLITAFKAFFNGTAVSLFTPNRSGEFAGRILYLKGGNRIRGAFLTFIGSTAQLLVTVQAGLLAFVILAPLLNTGLFPSEGITTVLALLLFIAATWGWLRMPDLVGFLQKIRLIGNWRSDLQVWKEVRKSTMLIVWGMSCIRYVVFICQQYCIFRFLSYPVPLDIVALYSALSFLLISVIPSIALSELGVRGGVTVSLFGLAGVPASIVLAATILLWSVNVAQPALFGAFSVFFMKPGKASSSA